VASIGSFKTDPRHSYSYNLLGLVYKISIYNTPFGGTVITRSEWL